MVMRGKLVTDYGEIALLPLFCLTFLVTEGNFIISRILVDFTISDYFD